MRFVVGFAPVTNLLALKEFSGIADPAPARALDVMTLADKLLDRPLWISIGDNDERVDSRHAIDFALRMMRISVRHKMPMTHFWSGDDILSNHYATSVHHNGFLYGFDGRQEQGCNLRCVELKTGKIRWSQDGFGAGSIVLAADQLLILTEKGQLIRALATPAEFKPTAQAQVLPYTVRACPALANGLLYARSKDKLICLDLLQNKEQARPAAK